MLSTKNAVQVVCRAGNTLGWSGVGVPLQLHEQKKKERSHLKTRSKWVNQVISSDLSLLAVEQQQRSTHDHHRSSEIVVE